MGPPGNPEGGWSVGDAGNGESEAKNAGKVVRGVLGMAGNLEKHAKNTHDHEVLQHPMHVLQVFSGLQGFVSGRHA